MSCYELKAVQTITYTRVLFEDEAADLLAQSGHTLDDLTGKTEDEIFDILSSSLEEPWQPGFYDWEWLERRSEVETALTLSKEES